MVHGPQKYLFTSGPYGPYDMGAPLSCTHARPLGLAADSRLACALGTPLHSNRFRVAPASVFTKMEGIKATIKLEVEDVLAELDFLLKVDQRRDLYEPAAIRRAVHR